MHEWTIRALIGAVGGSAHNMEKIKDKEVGSIVLDSRKLEPGDVFIATKGERVDGHSFIPQVMEKGALAVICEDAPEAFYKEAPAEPVPYIQVQDSFEALKAAASAYRGLLKIPFIGITGSVGKTSTKEMVSAVLAENFEVLKTEGNFNNEVGMPLTILQIKDYHTAAVLEMGINHFGEMERLSAIARPDVVIITSIAECHLEALGDLAGVLRAKSEIFSHMNPDGVVILNGDDKMLRTVKEVHGKAPIFYGFGDDKSAGCGHEPKLDIPFPLPGIHQARNALAAAAAGLALGLTEDQIREGLSKVKPVEGRGKSIDTGRFVIMDDCYNANPASTKAGISTLCQRRVAILGDMLELGPEAARMHYETGEYAGKAGIDVVVGIGELSTETVKGFQAAAPNTPAYHFATNEEFLEKAGEILQSGDRILLKASHGMHFEEILEKLKES